MYQELTNGILVEADPSYIQEKSNPLLKFFLFSYKINITNQSSFGCKLLTRHWIIRNGEGKEEIIFGKGVIGETPYLSPGESFSYISFCPLPTPYGNMRGTYEFLNDNKETLRVTIPLFFLRPS